VPGIDAGIYPEKVAGRAPSSALHGKTPAATFHHSTVDAPQAFMYKRVKYARFGFNRTRGEMMLANSGNRGARRRLRAAVAAAAALLAMGGAMPVHSAGSNAAADSAATPIKHLIVVIGENRSFDHIYATYVPKSGDSILNLLSEGIVQSDGSPGPNFAATQQFMTSGQTSYFIGVRKNNKTAYGSLPAPTLGGAPNNPSTTLPPFAVPCQPFLTQLAAIEPSLEPDDLCLLTTGATGAAGTTGPDPRIVNGAALPNGPFS
jgi:phospholipase C